MNKGHWLNPEQVVHPDIEKPCINLRYCPYGQLVEELIMTYEAEMKEHFQALADRIQELDDELKACENKLKDKQDIIQEIQDLVTT